MRVLVTVCSTRANELYGILENWYSSGFAEGWAEEIVCQTAKEGKRIEKEISQVADAEDC